MKEQFLKKLKNTFERYSKEPLELDLIGGAAYAFGSEVATLRLAYAYRHVKDADKIKAGFSENLGKYYFRFELDLPFGNPFEKA